MFEGPFKLSQKQEKKEMKSQKTKPVMVLASMGGNW